MKRPPLLITREDWVAAQKEYEPNCGPTALAAITKLPLMIVLPVIPNYKERHYTNPSMMMAALKSLKIQFHERDDEECLPHTLTRYGLCRIQWEGPWTAQNSHPCWAYRQTHWVAAQEFEGNVWVFDINNLHGWHLFGDWKADTVPRIIRNCCPKSATGNWWATHRWEIKL